MIKIAKNVLKTCMGLKKKESCLIVFDKNKKKIADAFFKAAKELCDDAGLIGVLSQARDTITTRSTSDMSHLI